MAVKPSITSIPGAIAQIKLQKATPLGLGLDQHFGWVKYLSRFSGIVEIFGLCLINSTVSQSTAVLYAH